MTGPMITRSPRVELITVRALNNVIRGDIVSFSSAGSATKGFDVIRAPSQDSYPAGIVYGRDIAAGETGQIQVRGFNPFVRATGAGVIVNALVRSAGNGQVTDFDPTIDMTTFPQILGKCLIAIDANGIAGVQIFGWA